MHGITLTKAPADWEILQQENGKASVALKGNFQVHPAAIEVGVERVTPVVRVMREDDNMTVIPWTNADHFTCNEKFQGEFEVTLEIPAGGPYRIDTSLETKSTVPDLTWLYRGDCVLHLGVGNLFIIAGQSNSAGYSRDFCIDPPSMDVHLYRNRNKWDIASHPMNESTFAGSLANEEMGVPGVSPYLAFGKTYDGNACGIDSDLSWRFSYGKMESKGRRFVLKYVGQDSSDRGKICRSALVSGMLRHQSGTGRKISGAF